MTEDIHGRLERISDIWTSYIWDFQFCKQFLKEDYKSNFFGDIITYFIDTQELVLKKPVKTDLEDKMSWTISFLQITFIHQDFITELFKLFLIDEKVLKQKESLKRIRDLRNELIGHPVRRELNKKKALISSTIFAGQSNIDEILYLRYHRDNKFRSERISVKIPEIQNMHIHFLVENLDVINDRLNLILSKFLAEIMKLKSILVEKDFIEIIETTTVLYERIHSSTHAYSFESLKIIYEQKGKHIRYQTFLDTFLSDLRVSIIDDLEYLNSFLEVGFTHDYSLKNPIVEEMPIVNKGRKRNEFGYYLSKLKTRNNIFTISELCGFFLEVYPTDKLLREESNNMIVNSSDEIEYYSSLNLIKLHLDKLAEIQND